MIKNIHSEHTQTAVQPSAHQAGAVKRKAGNGWIWTQQAEHSPFNAFTYFRCTFTLEALPADGTLYLAASSNAQLWVNGTILRRKVSRFDERYPTSEVVHAGPYLRKGANTITLLHHNWGHMDTFMRSGNQQAAFRCEALWLPESVQWQWRTAAQFLPHSERIRDLVRLNLTPEQVIFYGFRPEDNGRLRYPVIIDGTKVPEAPDAEEQAWQPAVYLHEGLALNLPHPVETPAQREYPVLPLSATAAGKLNSPRAWELSPGNLSEAMREAVYTPQQSLTQAANESLSATDAAQTCGGGAAKPIRLEGKQGESFYLTWDFHRPVHGFPALELNADTAGIAIDLGYGEIAFSEYDGSAQVDENGWVQVEGVVGKGYTDRYLTREGRQQIEFPDERTARWLVLHIHFPEDASVELLPPSFVVSQYPVRRIGSFNAPNAQLEQIQSLCHIHAEVSMTDAYVDTPGREDGQWIEDAHYRAQIAASWYGDFRLRQLLLRTFAQGQRECGNFHPFWPSSHEVMFPGNYDWTTQFIAILYDDYQWTGQTERIRKHWQTVRLFWKNALSHLRADGLWCTNKVYGDLRVGEPVQSEHQSSGTVTPWVIERLRWSADLARAIGEQADARSYEQTAQHMAEAFRRFHIVPAQEGIPAHVGDRFDPQDASLPRGFSQAGQTVAIMTGLLNQEEARSALRYAFSEPDGTPPTGVSRWNNPTYCYRSLAALSHCGLHELALAHLLERYAPYLPGNPRNNVPAALQGAFGGPLPEYFISRADINATPEQTNPHQPIDPTGSHGWSCVPLLWFHRHLLGVNLQSPGGAHISIAPEAAGLPCVSGHVFTPKGSVWVHWEPQAWLLEIGLPPEVEATVRLPSVCATRSIRHQETQGLCKRTASDTLQLSGAGLYRFHFN